MNRTRLPGNWSSTDNALEGLAFTVKDAILVIDDFAPPSSRVDADRQHRAAERLIRGQGNSAGRQRMRSDGSLRPPKPPRGLIVATGEDVPRGHSITARLGVVMVQRGNVNLARLSQCQGEASRGLFASAIAGFVAWLAPQYSDVRAGLAAERVELRDRFVGRFAHARTPDVIANLLLGLRYLLRFAEDLGCINEPDREALERRGEVALQSLAEEQCEHQRAADPVARFPEMLAAVISSGRGHIAGLDGREPEADSSPEVWGWHSQAGARGHKIGWIGETELYLDPDSTFAALSELAREQGQTYPVTRQTLCRRLKEDGILIRTDGSRTVYPVKLEGVRRRVLVLSPSFLWGKTGTTGTTGTGSRKHGRKCPGFLSRFLASRSETGTGNRDNSRGEIALRPSCPGCPGFLRWG